MVYGYFTFLLTRIILEVWLWTLQMAVTCVTSLCFGIQPHFNIVFFKNYSMVFSKSNLDKVCSPKFCFKIWLSILQEIWRVESELSLSKLSIPKMKIHFGSFVTPYRAYFQHLSKCVWIKGWLGINLSQFLFSCRANLCHKPKPKVMTTNS